MKRILLSLALLVLAGGASAEVPAEQAYRLYERTPEAFQAVSPVYGMIGLQSGILENIRFFGPYGGKDDHAPFPPHYSLLKTHPDEYPLDAVAALVQALFLSPDGSNFVATSRQGDPIGEIARDRTAMTRGKALGLGKIHGLIRAIRDYRAAVSAPPAAVAAGAAAAPDPGAAFETECARILGARAAAGTPGPDWAGRCAHTAHVLRAAVDEERADGTTGPGRKYPPDIVEVALLSYAWKAADDVDELYEAFDGGLLAKPAGGEARAVFTEAMFNDGLAGLQERARLAREHPGTHAGPATAELALFLSYAQSHAPIPRPFSYGMTSYQAATGKAIDYPDCVETSLRNFFNLLFCANGRFDPARFDDFVRKATATGEPAGEGKEPLESKEIAHAGEAPRLRALRDFYGKYPGLAAHGTSAAHHDWSQVVSNLNQAGDLLPVAYMRGPGKPPLVCELSSSMVNVLNVLAHLVPSGELQEPWSEDAAEVPKEIGRKWDALCALGSRTDQALSWRYRTSRQVPGNLFGELEFSIDGRPAFVWSIQEKHSSLDLVESAKEAGWRDDLAHGGLDPWIGIWLERFKLMNWMQPVGPLPQPCQLYGMNLRRTEGAVMAVDAIFARATPDLWPQASRLIRKGIPLDEFAITLLSGVFDRHQAKGVSRDPRLYPWPWLRHAGQEYLDNLLRNAFDTGRIPTARAALDHGAQKPPVTRWVQDALRTLDRARLGTLNSPQGIAFYLGEGGDPNVAGKATLLQYLCTVPGGRQDVVRLLVEAGADVLAAGPAGETLQQYLEYGVIRSELRQYLTEAIARARAAAVPAPGTPPAAAAP